MKKLALLTVCLASLFVACRKDKEWGEVLVQVGDSKLLLSEVLDQLPASSTGPDSAAFVSEYVEQWINEELVYQQGVRHLSNYDQLMCQVEEYRRMLIRQNYDRELLRRHEQDLTDEDFRSFYDKYGKQLILTEPVIKGFFVKVPTDKKNGHKNMKTWLKQLLDQNTDHSEELEQYLNLHAVDYDVFLEQWMPLTYVSERLPEQVVDAASFLKIGLTELADDDFSYLLLLADYRLDGEECPYEYVLPQIREILLNQHSRDFLKEAHQSMREHAIENGNLKINPSYTQSK